MLGAVTMRQKSALSLGRKTADRDVGNEVVENERSGLCPQLGMIYTYVTGSHWRPSFSEVTLGIRRL